MTDIFEIHYDSVRMPVRIKWSTQARRLILRMDQISEGGVLTVPSGTTKKEAVCVAQQNAAWLYAKIRDRPTRQMFYDGHVLSLLDTHVTIRHAPEERSGVQLNGSELIVSGQAEHMQRRVFDWLKGHTKDVIAPRAEIMADQLGKKIRKISVRNTQSRWGSCSHTGNLSFCWRLILTPNWVLNYVIAHEVSHLAHMNHGPAFWKTVETFEVEADRARTWLNKNSARLQRIGP